MKIIIILIIVLINSNLYAQKGSVTGLNIPRFVSLKSNDVNLRIGPSINYPIELKYIQKNYPIEIIDEFDVWRKIKDHEANIGWIHKSLIKGDRYILTGVKRDNEVNIYNRPNGKVIGLIKKNNILSLNNCIINWCNVHNTKIKGWVLKANIWGVYPQEVYKPKFYQILINQYWKILDIKLFK
tara:strand:+ start:154 stop:702 length:549 start_codon:yes stop_codon:yes gene_type:complete